MFEIGLLCVSSPLPVQLPLGASFRLVPHMVKEITPYLRLMNHHDPRIIHIALFLGVGGIGGVGGLVPLDSHEI